MTEQQPEAPAPINTGYISLPGEIQHDLEPGPRWIHKGCGGGTIWDMSGGSCTGCHAEGLDAADVEAASKEKAPAVPSPPVAAALDRAAIAPARDELASLQSAVRMLANIVARNALTLEAAVIEMRQNGPREGMQWIINSLPDHLDDDETKWDGKESAQAWFDRVDAAYRAAERAVDASDAASPVPVPAEAGALSTDAPAGLPVAAALDPGVRQRLEAALDASIDKCARCKVCDTQIGAAMTVLGPLLARAEAAEAQLAAIEARRSDIRRALEFAARNTVADEQAERYAEAWEALEPGGAGFDVAITGTEGSGDV
jgi:hypothetical protein